MVSGKFPVFFVFSRKFAGIYFMKKTSSLVIIAVLMILSGCIPGKVLTLETLQPAEISFPEDINSVLVFNFAYPPSADTSSFNELSKLGPKEQFFIDTIVIRNVFNGLFSVLDNSPASFLNNAPYYEIRPVDTTAFLKPLAASAIEELCDSFHVDAIISFEYYGASVDVKTYSSIVYDDEYEYVRVADEAMYRVMLWRIYERNRGIINEKFMKDTLYWSGYGYNDAEAKEDLPEIGDLFREAFWYGGYKYGSLISPNWDESRRAYYDIRDDKGDSISLNPSKLLDIAESNRKGRAYRASYNLALYYEMNDSIDQAMKWIDQAAELRPDAAYAEYYRQILKNRQKALGELEKQVE